jgi:hypothetical protein
MQLGATDLRFSFEKRRKFRGGFTAETRRTWRRKYGEGEMPERECKTQNEKPELNSP